MAQKDITNVKFNYLTGIRFVERIKSNYFWLYKCVCGNETKQVKTIVTAGKVISCGCKHKERLSKRVSGEGNYFWSGDDVGYFGIHKHIGKHNDKKHKCEFCKKNRKTEWANKKGRGYTRNIKDYFELCISCHKLYDSKIPNNINKI